MTASLTHRLHYTFRVACAMCFIGHGAFGIITKQVWCNYFGVFGMDEALAYQLKVVIRKHLELPGAFAKAKAVSGMEDLLAYLSRQSLRPPET